MRGRSAKKMRTRRSIIAGMSKEQLGRWRSIRRGRCLRRLRRAERAANCPGAIGDSPLIGCGCYADAEAGGVSSTGYGEAIMKVVMAKSATDFLRAKDSAVGATSGSEVPRAMLAAKKAVDLLAARTKATGGLILLDRDGLPGFAFNTPRMAYGFVEEDGEFFTSVE